MSWWMFVVAAVVAFVALAWVARRSWRASVRRELLEILREEEAGLEVVAEHETSLELRGADGTTGTAFLHNFYEVLAGAPPEDDLRREAIRTFARGLLGQQRDATGPLSLERHGDRLRPRLAPAGLVAEVGGDDLLHTDPGLPGLVVAYVLDSEHSVMYLTRSRLAEVGLDLDGLHALALRNLRETFPAAVVRAVVEKGQVNVVRAADSFDATRLLLVPGVLEDGESLAAVIPDRETLALLPVPADGNWRALDKLAREAASPYRLLDKPVLVTRAGFELMR